MTIENPDEVIREVSTAEIQQMQKHVLRFLPGLSGKCMKAASCLYTVTPDSRFVLDFHPTHPNVILASPCSGHGFKHSAAIGEVLSQMALDGKTTFDISSFSLKRLSK
jgi:sarcosine oxidase